MIRRILLHTSTMKRVLQKVGAHEIHVDLYAHAGETLEVGTEISEEKADALLAGGGASEVDPLDHDGDGRKGGAKGGKRRAKSTPAGENDADDSDAGDDDAGGDSGDDDEDGAGDASASEQAAG